MARSKKSETQATTAEAGMMMILDTPVEKAIDEAAKFVGVAEIRLLEMFSERLGLPEAMGWESVPIEHEGLLAEFKNQQDAFNSVRALEPEKEVASVASEMPVEPPIMEEEPKSKKRGGWVTIASSNHWFQKMNNTQNIHKLDRQVTAEFHKGMEWHLQGYDCPSQDSPRKLGWLAAQEMNGIKKRYLQTAKDTFVDVKK